MSLPLLQSYNDAKKQKAYIRYMEGGSQREISSKLKISRRTLASWSSRDRWEEEREARKIAASTEAIAAATAAGAAPDAPPSAPLGATAGAAPQSETRLQGMERILARQQRIVGKLVDAYERDLNKTLTDADSAGKLSRSQVAQLVTLGSNLLTMERKAWCVPDKIETKDTTPHKPDPVRELTDEQLERELEEARRERTAAAARETASSSVN
jgi:hypothetical protein